MYLPAILCRAERVLVQHIAEPSTELLGVDVTFTAHCRAEVSVARSKFRR